VTAKLLWTACVVPLHVNRLVLGLDVVNCQSPGPDRGILAPPSEGLISPSRSSLDTLASGVGAMVVTVCFTIETVELADRSFVVAGEMGGATVVVARGVSVVVVGIVVVDTCGTVVVTLVRKTTWCTLSRTALFDDVSVKTNTSSKSGLDHISRWVLRNEKRCLDMVLAG
jgi:hypothetical protein